MPRMSALQTVRGYRNGNVTNRMVVPAMAGYGLTNPQRQAFAVQPGVQQAVQTAITRRNEFGDNVSALRTDLDEPLWSRVAIVPLSAPPNWSVFQMTCPTRS